MATPIINNLVLPHNCILVELDADSQTTGTIIRRSMMGGGQFKAVSDNGSGPEISYDHVLFCKELATEIEIEGLEYLVMHQSSVVGLIPD